jgi:hypothetical protein
VLGSNLLRCVENFLLAAVCHGERRDDVYGLAISAAAVIATVIIGVFVPALAR